MDGVGYDRAGEIFETVAEVGHFRRREERKVDNAFGQGRTKGSPDGLIRKLQKAGRADETKMDFGVGLAAVNIPETKQEGDTGGVVVEDFFSFVED